MQIDMTTPKTIDQQIHTTFLFFFDVVCRHDGMVSFPHQWQASQTALFRGTEATWPFERSCHCVLIVVRKRRPVQNESPAGTVCSGCCKDRPWLTRRFAFSMWTPTIIECDGCPKQSESPPRPWKQKKPVWEGGG
jgi:hypothetical protein